MIEHTTPQETGEHRSFIRRCFDVSKKIIDLLDDIWSLMRGIIPTKIYTLVGPILTAIVGSIVHSAELLQAIKELHYAINNRLMAQRKTRIASNTVITLLCLTGIGLSIVLLAGSAGAAVGNLFVFIPMITGLLTAIYTVELMKRSYVLHQINNNPESLPEKKLDALRDVAFGAIEVFASGLVLIGTILTTAGLLSASVIATLGIMPIAILATGVSLAVLSKTLELFDNHYNHAITLRLQKWIVSELNTLEATPKPTPQSTASIKKGLSSEGADSNPKAVDESKDAVKGYSIDGDPSHTLGMTSHDGEIPQFHSECTTAIAHARDDIEISSSTTSVTFLNPGF